MGILHQPKTRKFFLFSSLLFALVSCGGDDSENLGQPATEDQIRAEMVNQIKAMDALRVSDLYPFPSSYESDLSRNDPYFCFIDSCALSVPPTKGGLMRFEAGADSPVVIYYALTEGQEEKRHPDVLAAISTVNSIIGRTVFSDGGFIRIPPISPSTGLPDYSDRPGKVGGLIISMGTAFRLIGGTECGSWTNSPETMNSGSRLVYPNGYYAQDKGWSWVNIGGPDCGFSPALVVHELAHALGMSHFPGFGEGPMFDARAKSVLKTLYNNPVGTPAEALEIKIVN